ncbi:MAG: hypothetical protein NTX52_14650 [Planctomycetota bacterium]|nr:hypothetical protein [Planctomycetota bacterium]
MKRCTKCKKWKDESEFSIQHTRKDGLRYWCKKCECDYMHKRYHENRPSLRRYRSYEQCHRVVNGVKQKRCSKCKQWKPDDGFHRSRSSKDGLGVWCKKCAREAACKSRKRSAIGGVGRD